MRGGGCFLTRGGGVYEGGGDIFNPWWWGI